MSSVGIKFCLTRMVQQAVGYLLVLLGLVLTTGCSNAPSISYYVQPRGSSIGVGTHVKTGCFIGSSDGKTIRMSSHPDLTNLCLAKDRLIGWQMMGSAGQEHPGVRIFSLPEMNLLVEVPGADVIAGGDDGLVIFYKDGFSIQQLDQLIQSKGAVTSLLPYPKELGGSGVPAISDGGIVVFSKGQGIVVYDIGSGKVLKDLDLPNEGHWPGRFVICGRELFWVNITGESVLCLNLDSYKYSVVAEGSRFGIAKVGEKILLIKKGKLGKSLCSQPAKPQ